MSVYVRVFECVSIPPAFVLADVSYHRTLVQLFGSDGRSLTHAQAHTHRHTHTPDAPVQYQCK